ncbi:hypothetical protein IAT40_007723 [Kwoniella sp. CBS 6097]
MVRRTSSTSFALMGLLAMIALPTEGALHLPMARIDTSASGGAAADGASSIVQALLLDRRRSFEKEDTEPEPRYLPNNVSSEELKSAEARAIKLALKPHTQDAAPVGGRREFVDKRQGQSTSASQTSSASLASTTLTWTSGPSSTTAAGGNNNQSNASSTSAGVWGVDPKSTLRASSTIEADYPSETMTVNGVTGAGIIYTMDITVDGATLPVHIDTGSSQLWVPHASCAPCVKAGMRYVNTTLPDNCASDGRHELKYAKGAVAGCLVNTSVTLGDDTLAQYSVLAVTQVTADITANAEYYSGRIGLAGSNLTIDKGPTVISALYEQGHIQTPVVGFYLPHRDEAWESEISFGDPETSEHADTQRQVTLPSVGDPDEHYIVRFDEFKINGQHVAGSFTSYIDTGFSGLAVALSLHEHVLKEIYVNYTKEESGVSVPCTPEYEWPILTFQFGSQAFDIDYRDMITHPDDDPDGKCWSLIFGMPEDYKGLETPWVLGDTFLHNVYHSVNVETGEVKIFGLKDEANTQT